MKRRLHLKLVLVLRAAGFAVLVVGVMSLGLGLTTYTLARANDYALTLPSAQSDNPAACLVN